MKRLLLVALWLIGSAQVHITAQSLSSPDDSGMWLLPQLEGALFNEFRLKGLRLSPNDIYQPDGKALNHAIVRINVGEDGGGSGSFVSASGLILTNHHVAYDAIASLSTAEQNLLQDGYVAASLFDELPAYNYQLFIPLEQIDVTEFLESQYSLFNDPSEIQAVREQLIYERIGEDPDLTADIDDYWAGSRQFLSVYRIIRDVRLVFAPPSSIGKFGGDIDNWMWPRHTGDFTYLRAYVAPDGSSAEYSEENVPYVPNRYLRISTKGLSEQDFTMVMGFPGSTYRAESSHAFNFYEHHRNPYLIAAFEALVSSMNKVASTQARYDVETAADRASFANTLKYFQGVQQGFKTYNVVKEKQRQEKAFQAWIDEDPIRMADYGDVLDELERGYEIASTHGDKLFSSIYALNYSALLSIASNLDTYYDAVQSDTAALPNKVQRADLLNQVTQNLAAISLEAEWLILEKLIRMLCMVPDNQRNTFVKEQFGTLQGEALEQAISTFIAQQKQHSIVVHPKLLSKTLELNKKKARTQKQDALYRLFKTLYNDYYEAQELYWAHVPVVYPALSRYITGMLEMSGDSTHYPDANFTARISGGRVLGYQPVDGVYYLPFTYIEGLMQKGRDADPFIIPIELKQAFEAYQRGEFTNSPYVDAKGKLIVNFLSTNDITGGNSGSPVLNGDGALVGLAFDGNFEGVVGDYFYDAALNRTISVDIRFVLFVTDVVYGMKHLIQEMSFVK